MTGRTWGRGQEMACFKHGVLKCQKAVFVYFHKMNHHIFTVIKKHLKVMGNYMVSEAI